MLFSLSKLFPCAILLIFSNSVIGWGRSGHLLIAEIAQSLLTTEATTFVNLHLPLEANGSMSNVSAWADNILYADTEPNYSNWQWSGPLHYVNTKDWSCVYDRESDCNWTTDRGCIDGAIQNYTNRLANQQLDHNQTEEALKFLIHFIGDVHQPLHGGFADDRGGNSIRVNFFGQSVNLHSLWDTTMIQRKINDQFLSQTHLYLQYLISQMDSRYAQNVSDWTQCSSPNDSRYLACSSVWLQEDADLSCRIVYRDEYGEPISSATTFSITETYYITRMDTVELRLIQAGVRLAAVINEIARGTQPATVPQLSCLVTVLISIFIALVNSVQ